MVKLSEKEDWDLSPIINLISSLSVPKDVHLVTDVQSRRSEDLNDASLSELPAEEEDPHLGNFNEIWELLGVPPDDPPPKVNPSLKVDPHIFSGPKVVHVTGNGSSNYNSNANETIEEIFECLGLPRDPPQINVNPSLKADPHIFSGPKSVHVTGIESNNYNSNVNETIEEIFECLGLPRDTPPPKVIPSLKADPHISSGLKAFHITGDDSSNDISNAKGVRWRDEAEGADLEDNDQQEALNSIPNDSGLTRSQKRKQKRKLQKEQTKKASCTAQVSASGIPSDSISDTEDNDQHDGSNLMNNDSSLTKSQLKKQRRKLQKARKYEALCTAQLSASGIQSDSTVERQSKTRRALIQQITNITPAQVHSRKLPENLSQAFVENCRRNGIVVGNDSFALIRTQSAPIISAVPPTISSHEVNLSVAATKKAALLSKLKAQFVDEKLFLENLAVLQYTTNGNEASVEGIHVFVDISNILIGFHDALKLARGLSIHTRLRRQTLSFHNLSLILERGRPTAKRVLAGSDNIDATQEAYQLGYETNILDRVHKAKPLTASQKRYLQPPDPFTTNPYSGQSSGSDTNATHGPEKWVEQAVDEILHLKILESVVDAPTPSTIVLATGDAAEAEYSGGFLKMVERALTKGWRVEVVSFRHNTSGAYRRKEFRAMWGERFRTVELDPFVEELLGVQA
ncbi:hypothetical protein MMC17_005024 [Xylographa soralifera]|nr:hypothetical protein [Xylographa soralifera]